MIFPVRYFIVQHIKSVSKYGIPEEAQSKCESNELDDPITRCERYNNRHQGKDTCKTESRCNQKERWCWRKDAVISSICAHISFQSGLTWQTSHIYQ